MASAFAEAYAETRGASLHPVADVEEPLELDPPPEASEHSSSESGSEQSANSSSGEEGHPCHPVGEVVIAVAPLPNDQDDTNTSMTTFCCYYFPQHR